MYKSETVARLQQLAHQFSKLWTVKEFISYLYGHVTPPTPQLPCPFPSQPFSHDLCFFASMINDQFNLSVRCSISKTYCIIRLQPTKPMSYCSYLVMVEQQNQLLFFCAPNNLNPNEHHSFESALTMGRFSVGFWVEISYCTQININCTSSSILEAFYHNLPWLHTKQCMIQEVIRETTKIHGNTMKQWNYQANRWACICFPAKWIMMSWHNLCHCASFCWTVKRSISVPKTSSAWLVVL